MPSLAPFTLALALTLHCTLYPSCATHSSAPPARHPTYSHTVSSPSRYDIAFLEPFKLEELPRAQLWLPGQCCTWRPDPFTHAVPDSMSTASKIAEQACLGGLGRVVDLCRVSHYLDTKGAGPGSGKFTLAREAERNMYINDWFFIAPSRTADTWAHLYDNYDRYIAALNELGIPPLTPHPV